MTNEFWPELSKYNYFTSEGVNEDGFVDMDLCKYKEVDPVKYDYMPCLCNTLEDVQHFYEAKYPKLPEELQYCMARMAIGKPINRNERRRMAREKKKQQILS